MDKIKTVKIQNYQTNSSTSYDNQDLPRLKFGGKWLLNSGFKCGDVVSISIEDDKIILQKVSADKQLEIERHNLQCRINKHQIQIAELEEKYSK